MRSLFVGAALAVAAFTSPAFAATTHTLSLLGDTTNLTNPPTQFQAGGFIFEVYEVQLFNLDSSGITPFLLSDGDTINFDIGFTGVFNVPGAVAGGAQFLGVNFKGDGDNPPAPAPGDPEFWSNNGSFNFTGVTDPALFGGVGSGCGNCLSAIFGRPGPASGFQFGALSGSSLFSMLAPFDSYEISSVSISYQVQIGTVPTGAIPEPASWAMLIAGFGLIGAVQRRRVLTIAA